MGGGGRGGGGGIFSLQEFYFSLKAYFLFNLVT